MGTKLAKRFVKILLLIVALGFVIFLTQTYLSKQKESKPEYVAENKETIKTEKKLINPIDEYIEYDFIEDSLQEDSSYLYLALGDSLTKGVGDEQKQGGFSQRLAEKIEDATLHEVELDNRGKRGRKSDQLLKLVKKGQYDDEIRQANLITITIGGNDMMKIVKKNLFKLEKEPFDKEREKYEERLSKIISNIREENPLVPIVLVGIYNPFPYISDEVKELDTIVDEWNESIKAIANQDKYACFVNVADLFQTNVQMVYHTDFFHPNSYGYTLMSDRVFHQMLQCDVIKPSPLFISH